MTDPRPATCDPTAHAEFNARVVKTAFQTLSAKEIALVESVTRVAESLSLRGDEASLTASVDLLVSVARYVAGRVVLGEF